jgi:hypothetical protein
MPKSKGVKPRSIQSAQGKIQKAFAILTCTAANARSREAGSGAHLPRVQVPGSVELFMVENFHTEKGFHL